jgi:opine dehydrogenase
MHHLGRDVFGPTDPESRYVVEDVPYGLVLTVILGRLLNVPAQLHESGIMILSAMYGRDFLVENELLQGLGLISDNELKVDAYTMQEWKEMANRGYFREK